MMSNHTPKNESTLVKFRRSSSFGKKLQNIKARYLFPSSSAQQNFTSLNDKND